MEYQITTITTMGSWELAAVLVGKVYLAYNELSPELLQTEYMSALLLAIATEEFQEKLSSKKLVFQHVTIPFELNGSQVRAEVYLSRNFAGLVYALLQTAPATQPA